MIDVLSNFTCLDELTQVIYQSFYKFVVLSSVSDSEWNIHLGLAGQEGRWWRGCWREEDILLFFGSKSSDNLLESFAEKLADVFIQGEICISDWTPDKGANIKFTLGPSSKKPVHIPLTEMTAEEAAAYATTVFIAIALQAQSRKCKLYPSSLEYTAFSTPYVPERSGASKQKEPDPSGSESVINREMLEEVAKKPPPKDDRKPGPPAGKLTSKPAPPVRVQKGASLANPNKKARKYQAIEFESDDE